MSLAMVTLAKVSRLDPSQGWQLQENKSYDASAVDLSFTPALAAHRHSKSGFIGRAKGRSWQPKPAKDTIEVIRQLNRQNILPRWITWAKTSILKQTHGWRGTNMCARWIDPSERRGVSRPPKLTQFDWT
jgi:hypothetical protein